MALRTEEQTMLMEAVSAWSRDHALVRSYRSLRDERRDVGFDSELYAEMAEMGWTAILVPEKYGGVDFGFQSMGLVVEELGRHLTASPLISTAAGGVSALLLGGTHGQKESYLPRISSGELIMALALDEGAHHMPDSCDLTATVQGDGWQLTGRKTAVLQGNGADILLVSARVSDASVRNGITLFAVEADKTGLRRHSLFDIDVRGACDVVFQDVYVERSAMLGEVGAGAPLLDEVLDRVRILTAAEMLGSALQAFDVTIEYLKTRKQFGQTIGSFQALQHRAANLLGELELTRTAVDVALTGLDEGAPDLSVLASTAKVFAGETLKMVTAEMIQMHGGIGMTDEHDAGLYYKRAFAADQAYGSASFHRERFARLNGY